MNRSFYTVLGTCFALAAAGLTTLNRPAFAQQNSETIMEEIVVVAPRLVRREQLGRTRSGGNVELITLTRRVSYADLNLEMHADVMELERRVNDMAREACDMIEEAFPMVDTEPTNEDCIRQAVDGAMTQVREAVSEATL